MHLMIIIFLAARKASYICYKVSQISRDGLILCFILAVMLTWQLCWICHICTAAVHWVGCC